MCRNSAIFARIILKIPHQKDIVFISLMSKNRIFEVA